MSNWDEVSAPSREWAVEDRVPTGHTFLLSGAGSAGKSLIMLQETVCHPLGHRWLGAPVKQGPAVFIDAEDGPDEIHRRLVNIARHHDAKFADLAKGLLSAALERHLLLLSCGTWGQAVRVIPPLVTTDGEIDQALAIIGESLASIN